MKKRLLSALSFLTLTFITSSGSAQDNSLFRHISPDANNIYRINLGSIMSKVNLADLMSRMPAPKNLNAADQHLMEFLKDPSSSGVDFKSDMLLTYTTKDLMDSASYTTVAMHLTDSSKFRAMLRKQMHGIRITRYPDKSYSAFKDKMAVAWNNELAVIVTVKPSVTDAMAQAGAMGKMDDQAKKGGSPKPASPAHAATVTPMCLAALKGWALPAYTEDPAFKATFSSDADIQMSMQKTTNYLSLFKKFIPSKVLGGLNLDALFIHKNSYASIWFENGRIRMQSTGMLMPDVAQDLAKFTPPDINPDLFARIPKGDLLAVMSMRLNMHVLGYMLHRLGVYDKLDSALSTKNVSLKDFGKAFKGDFLLAAIMSPRTDSFQRPKPAIYLVSSIGDSSALHRVGQLLMSAKDSTGDDSTGKKATASSKIKNLYAMKNNILVFSGDKNMADGYFENTERRSPDFLSDGMKQNQTYVWIDIHAIVNSFMGPVQPDQGNKKMKMMNGMHSLDKLIFSKGLTQNGETTGYFELSVTNKDQNILKTVIDMIPAAK